MKPVTNHARFILPQRTLALMLVALVVSLLPLWQRLPLWASLFALLLGGFRWWIAIGRRPLPPRWLRWLITLAAAGAVVFSHQALFTREAGLTLITIMLALKLYELNALRDAMLLVFIGYFLTAAQFFYDQSITTLLLMCVVLWLFTMVLIELASHETRRVVENAKAAGKMLLQSLPLALVMFLLFPRLADPLWALPNVPGKGRTGISDIMEPGSITELTLSDGVAFRAEFKGERPSRRDFYWRGPVFYQTDGRRWHATINKRWIAPGSTVPFSHTQERIDYTLYLEPSNQRWLFALDLPSTVPDQAWATPELNLISEFPLTNRTRFELSSHPNYRHDVIDRRMALAALQLPENLSDRVRELGESWRTDEADDATVVDRGLRYFREQPFVYTLLPDPVGDDPVHDFLFVTKEGFCEYYATAFTTLMRVAGIPARIVTGYQGGEYNGFGNHLVVYQSDAHAWTEVWLPTRGWVRVDPTAAVAPERIERRIDNSLLSRNGAVSYLAEVGLFAQIGALYEGVQYVWSRWVVNYNLKDQLALLSTFGLSNPRWEDLIKTMLFGGAMVLLLLVFAIHRLQRRSTDKVGQHYAKFRHGLRLLNIPAPAHAGPRALSSAFARQFPSQQQLANQVVEPYIDIRYASGTGKLQTLRRSVANFMAFVRRERLNRLMRRLRIR